MGVRRRASVDQTPFLSRIVLLSSSRADATVGCATALVGLRRLSVSVAEACDRNAVKLRPAGVADASGRLGNRRDNALVLVAHSDRCAAFPELTYLANHDSNYIWMVRQEQMEVWGEMPIGAHRPPASSGHPLCVAQRCSAIKLCPASEGSRYEIWGGTGGRVGRAADANHYHLRFDSR